MTDAKPYTLGEWEADHHDMLNGGPARLERIRATVEALRTATARAEKAEASLAAADDGNITLKFNNGDPALLFDGRGVALLSDLHLHTDHELDVLRESSRRWSTQMHGLMERAEKAEADLLRYQALLTNTEAKLDDARAENARLRESNARLLAALETIRRGRTHEDNAHPLGVMSSMAGRFMEVAKVAIAIEQVRKVKP